MNTYKIGDIVKVVAAKMSFGDYQNGDTARIESIDEDGDLWVEWVTRNPTKPSRSASSRMLFPSEVELVTPPGGAPLNGLGPAQYPSPKQSLIARAMAKSKRSK